MRDNVQRLEIPPHSPEAEQALIGSVLMENGAYRAVCELVRAKYFYSSQHRAIWRAIEHFAEANQEFDALVVHERLQLHEETKQVPLSYLGAMQREQPGSSNAKAYARMVYSYALRRATIAMSERIKRLAIEPEGMEVSEVLDYAGKEIHALSLHGERYEIPDMVDCTQSAVEEITSRFESPDSTLGVPTGFADLDFMTSGLQNSDLVVIGARTSMGKTALAMNIAVNAAKKSVPVGIFSLEMPTNQLMMRLISSEAKINLTKLRNGRIVIEELERVRKISERLQNMPIYIDDTGALNPMDIRIRARRLQKEKNIGLIVIDYLQFIIGKGENKNLEISNTVRSLKNLAKELDIPVLVLSQLNRQLNQRDDKRPMLSDLRDSGSIEQDADIVLFVYRDEVYHAGSENQGKAELIIAKSRNGPVGTINLTFRGEYVRFDNYAR